MSLFKKHKVEKQLFEIFPITKSIQFKTGLDQHTIKLQVVQKMLSEILMATNFKVEEKSDGTTLMVGRLDVCRRIDEEGNSNDGKEET